LSLAAFLLGHIPPRMIYHTHVVFAAKLPVFSRNMALQINIVNGHEDLLSPFVGNFEFACGK